MSKKTIVWIIIILVVIIGAWLLSEKLTGKGLDEYLGFSPTPTSELDETPTATPKTSKKATPTPTPTAGITYEQALTQYAGKKVQFNEKCQGMPGQLTLKAGEKMLLDNRSSDSKTLTMNGQTYVLPGYNWRVVTVSATKSLPYSATINCNSSNGSTMMNNVTLNLQANIGEGL